MVKRVLFIFLGFTSFFNFEAAMGFGNDLRNKFRVDTSEVNWNIKFDLEKNILNDLKVVQKRRL